MEPEKLHIQIYLCLLLITSSYSNVGKMTSSQNHFGSTVPSQFITKNNTRVIAQKGGLAILPCVVKVNSPATVSWIRRKDFQLLTVGLSTHSSDKRFLVEHTRHMGHWSLRIKAVREDDKGLYECQLSIYPTQSIFIELKIVEAVAEISNTSDILIDEASTLQLQCKLKGATENPSFVFWYHESKMVNYDAQGGFVVTSVAENELPSEKNGQSYQTSANGGKSKSFREVASGSIEINSSNANATIYEDMAIVTTPVNPFSTFQVQQYKSPYIPNSSMSVLTIKTVTFHHAGNYTCAPSNARPASITVHVLRGEKPAAMQHANRSILDGENSNTTVSLTILKGINGTNSLMITVPSLFLPVLCLLANFPSTFHLQKHTPMIFFLFVLSNFNS
ncbi:uncharacterized protein LOC6578211 isoform X4 [Drosophila mojavensis]|uniref:Uncharacterized protein, isoform B n=1 Tax=Drosophila mojavensis TaxID=7230 RepID=B4KJI9_DROMO|nr:uncharacterized protein LOC6578211 isoform X4 [Drosophila mojavensis]EDW13569.2 uncharacterized protein Dmoj_GI18281, isoform F [Drosophila mojavensis]KRG03875.1 uncharacterized protein Dmoj_GI18281, isoform B [Drosophila mojavensis]KRG03876.1 uncharacterized protein Dmoj_GI18281, isoform C [Drosophila mojavensis]KRG03878.1 uncharacterized protein Dmoj_GI18281, isoform E [Drosophila mojavensis]